MTLPFRRGPRLHVACKDCGAWITDDPDSPRIKLFMRLHYWVDIDANDLGRRGESDDAGACTPP